MTTQQYSIDLNHSPVGMQRIGTPQQQPPHVLTNQMMSQQQMMMQAPQMHLSQCGTVPMHQVGQTQLLNQQGIPMMNSPGSLQQPVSVQNQIMHPQHQMLSCQPQQQPSQMVRQNMGNQTQLVSQISSQNQQNQSQILSTMSSQSAQHNQHQLMPSANQMVTHQHKQFQHHQQSQFQPSHLQHQQAQLLHQQSQNPHQSHLHHQAQHQQSLHQLQQHQHPQLQHQQHQQLQQAQHQHQQPQHQQPQHQRSQHQQSLHQQSQHQQSHLHQSQHQQPHRQQPQHQQSKLQQSPHQQPQHQESQHHQSQMQQSPHQFQAQQPQHQQSQHQQMQHQQPQHQQVQHQAQQQQPQQQQSQLQPPQHQQAQNQQPQNQQLQHQQLQSHSTQQSPLSTATSSCQQSTLTQSPGFAHPSQPQLQNTSHQQPSPSRPRYISSSPENISHNSLYRPPVQRPPAPTRAMGHSSAIRQALGHVPSASSSNSSSSSTSVNQPLSHEHSIVAGNLRLIDKGALEALVKSVDPLEMMEEDVSDALMQLVEEFVDELLNQTVLVAKHRVFNTIIKILMLRSSSKLEAKDVQYVLERYYRMYLPSQSTNGLSSERSSFFKSPLVEAHRQRLQLIKKLIQKP